MIYTWLSFLDAPDRHLRIFLDFSKAFDRIGHNIPIGKLIDLAVRRSLIPWVISFLSNRRPCVKLGESVSDYLLVNAGVPKGTKLGPILFLIMVNDLRVAGRNTTMWKCVDDVSTSENLQKDSISNTQATHDTVNL